MRYCPLFQDSTRIGCTVYANKSARWSYKSKGRRRYNNHFLNKWTTNNFCLFCHVFIDLDSSLLKHSLQHSFHHGFTGWYSHVLSDVPGAICDDQSRLQLSAYTVPRMKHVLRNSRGHVWPQQIPTASEWLVMKMRTHGLMVLGQRPSRCEKRQFEYWVSAGNTLILYSKTLKFPFCNLFSQVFWCCPLAANL